MRLAILLAAAAVAGCGTNFNSNLPDGGKAYLYCAHTPLTVAIRVVDKAGAPVVGATVSINNQQNGKSLTATTDARGVFDLDQDDVGPGLTEVYSSFNGFDTQRGAIQFVCGECSCAATPANLVLRLQ